jgi:hypothetical protein
MKLLFATTNAAKIERMKIILKNESIKLLSLNDLDYSIAEPIEDGNSAEENARIKSEHYYRNLKEKLPVLSLDDTLFFRNVSEEDNPGVYIKEAVLKKYSELTHDNILKYYCELAEKYSGSIDVEYKYGHSITDESGTRSSNSIVYAKQIDKYTDVVMKGYPLAQNSIVNVNGEYKYWSEMTENEAYERDKDLLRAIKEILNKF